MTQFANRTFELDCRDSVQAVRGALIELYDHLSLDTEASRDVARSLNLNKNLTWKLSRIINSPSTAEAASLFPGASGMNIFIKAVQNAGATPQAIAKLEASIQSFDRMVEIHVGNRAALDLILDSMAGMGTDPLEMSRKIAFRGNSGIWGVQTYSRIATYFLAPNADDPSRLDFVLCSGMVDFQRLRPSSTWPLFRMRRYNDDGSDIGSEIEPLSLNAAEDDEAPLLLREFSTGHAPDVEVLKDHLGELYRLGPGNVGKTGRFSVFVGYLERAAASRYRDEHDTIGELIAGVSTPAENLLFDLIVHRDLADEIDPQVRVYGNPSGNLDQHMYHDDTDVLPIYASMRTLGGTPPVVTTPLVPRYQDLIASVYERCGWNPSEFTGWRLQMKHPPMPSSVAVHYELPERPS